MILKKSFLIPMFIITLIFLCFISVVHSFRDLRYVSYEDLHMSSDTQMFHQSNISSYLQPLFHSSRDQIIIAAKNHLIRLQASSLNLIEMVTWKPQTSQKLLCRGMSTTSCENYIQLLVEHKDVVIACGTNALSPQCTWRNATSLSQIFKNDSGLGRSSYSPRYNISFLMTSSGNLYTALPLDASGKDSAIVRNIGSSVPLRSDKSNSFWLDKPNFVGMFELGEHVYIFFREVAVDKISCGKSTVSRVARICKSDEGGTTWILKNNWVSFLKASLNCSRPGEYPFYYDEIQSVHFNKQTAIFTAVFTTHPNSLYGSAVCEYSIEGISEAMSGKLKTYSQKEKIWKSKHSQHAKKCPSTNDDEDLKHQVVLEASQYQMAMRVVQPLQIHPIIERSHERYNHIEVETTKGTFRNKPYEFKIIYMTTFEGLIHKYVIVPNHNTTKHVKHKHPHHNQHHRKIIKISCFLETIQLLPLDQPQAVNFLKINPTTKYLVIGTENRLYQIPRFRCQKFKNKITCRAAQEPHCSWLNSHCTFTSTPSISSCPHTHLIGKTWYGWSDWSDCSVTCGEGVQMRMVMCLNNIKQLIHSNNLKNSCTKNSLVTRTCSKKLCQDQPDLSEDYEEKKDKTVLEVSKKKYKKEKNEPKRLESRDVKKSYSRQRKRYNQYSNMEYNSRFTNKSNSNVPLSSIHSIELSANKKGLNTKNIKNIVSINDRFYKNIHSSKKAVRPNHHSQNDIFSKTTSTPNLLLTTKSTVSHTTSVHLPIETTACPCHLQIPAHMGIFYGYCGCRDMGAFRVCHKCNSD